MNNQWKNTTLSEQFQILLKNGRKNHNSYLYHTNIHDRSFSWHGMDTSIYGGGVKLVLWTFIAC